MNLLLFFILIFISISCTDPCSVEECRSNCDEDDVFCDFECAYRFVEAKPTASNLNTVYQAKTCLDTNQAACETLRQSLNQFGFFFNGDTYNECLQANCATELSYLNSISCYSSNLQEYDFLVPNNMDLNMIQIQDQKLPNHSLLGDFTIDYSQDQKLPNHSLLGDFTIDYSNEKKGGSFRLEDFSVNRDFRIQLNIDQNMNDMMIDIQDMSGVNENLQNRIIKLPDFSINRDFSINMIDQNIPIDFDVAIDHSVFSPQDASVVNDNNLP